MLSVSDRLIDVKAKSTGQNVSIPHGMVVWSTGVGTRPVVKDFMEQIGQVVSMLANVMSLFHHNSLLFSPAGEPQGSCYG